MHKWLRRFLIAALAIFLVGEIIFRLLGFRQYPLFRTDPRYEYVLLPDQDTHPGMVHFVTNEAGMRCGPIGPKKKRRVLVFGDSVINGGYQTTQDSLATAIAERSSGVQVLNCSAPSWGASNIAAWWRAHGTFQSDAVVIVLSSHDRQDYMTYDSLVGHHPSYPDHRPLLAWELFAKKVWYRFGGYGRHPKPPRFDEGWATIRDLSRAQGIPVSVLLHAEQGEVKMKHYDDRGTDLLDSLTTWNIPVTRALPRMRPGMYTDHIHINNDGQRVLAGVLEGMVGR